MRLLLKSKAELKTLRLLKVRYFAAIWILVM